MALSSAPRSARSRRRMWISMSCVVVGLAITPWLLASDQRVSIAGDDASGEPRVAHLGDGTTVYAWSAVGDGGAGLEILARRFDSVGIPLSDPFVVNTYSTGRQRWPDVGGDGAGGFVVTWRHEPGGAAPDAVRGRVFASDGSPFGGELLISDAAVGGYTMRPEVAVHDDGSFVVVWESFAIDGSGLGVAGRRFDATGMALGPELTLNGETEGDQTRPNLAMDGDGNFLVTWHDSGIQGRLYASDGTPQGGDFELANVFGFFNETAVAMAPDGRFAVAYILDPDNGIPTIQRFDATGMPLEGPIALSADTSTRKEEPAIAAHSDGTFHVVWEQFIQSFADDIMARTVRPDGTLVGSAEVRVNQLVVEPTKAPDVASNGDGQAIYTWKVGVFDQYIYTNCEGLGPCSVFADGFESGDTAAWSAAFPP